MSEGIWNGLLQGIFIAGLVIILQNFLEKKKPQDASLRYSEEASRRSLTGNSMGFVSVDKVRFTSLCFTDRTLYGVDDKGRLWYVDLSTGGWSRHPSPDDPDAEIRT